ncbi:hypothetical protein DL96DRAFT_1633594 [Flagelloscypha sp. PMI_526]|nr:hypothetical protein DL96DRAFT_1633594 [Flagelloscypha sp. PMI_526]
MSEYKFLCLVAEILCTWLVLRSSSLPDSPHSLPYGPRPLSTHIAVAQCNSSREKEMVSSLFPQIPGRSGLLY